MGTVLCDFIVIQGDTAKRIGDGGITLWEKQFNTGGRRSSGGAILMLMVKGLTEADSNVSQPCLRTIPVFYWNVGNFRFPIDWYVLERVLDTFY